MMKLRSFLFAFFSAASLMVHAQDGTSSNAANAAMGAFTLYNNLHITTNGNIGIGTYNPPELLTVNGKILCEEVEVVLDVGPDYVFQKYYTGTSSLKPNYNMPTLQEVEVFIKTNYHLPEIPSTAEMQNNGVEVSNMVKLLLQKVEELTLYTIEQEKRIKALEVELKSK